MTNTPPTADAGADAVAEAGDLVSLVGSGSSANDAGQSLTYAWSQTSGPTANIVGADLVNPRIVLPPSANAGDVVVFSLVVNDGIEDSVADTVSITIFDLPDPDAGPDQTVASGAFVQLDGSGSTPGAPNPSIVQYIWTPISGPSITLTDEASATPSFTAPIIPAGQPAEDIVILLVVFDGVSYSATDSVTITVNPSTDVTSPTVDITGLPSNYQPGQDFTADIGFSEPVIGFEAGDITVVNGTVASLAGSGASYVATITPAGPSGDIEISIAAGVATDPSLNPNEASAVLALSPDTSSLTSEFIADAMVARGKALILAQPNLRSFLGTGSSGGFKADITRGAGNILLSTGQGSRLWTHASAIWSDDGNLASSYANIAIGAHLWKGENLILGAMAEYDRSASEFGGDDFVGTGWLAGPYLVAQLPNQPLVFSASYLMGRTENEVALDGLPTDRFSSNRRLLTLGAEGSYGFGNDLTLIPSLDFYHLTDEQGVFRDSNGFDVPAQTVRISEANIGLGFEKPISLANGDLTLFGGINGVYHKVDALTQDETSLHGRVNAGLNYTFANGSRLRLSSHYDGLGQSGYEAYGADVVFELTF